MKARSVFGLAGLAWVVSLMSLYLFGIWAHPPAVLGSALVAIWALSSIVMFAVAVWKRPRLVSAILFVVAGLLWLSSLVLVGLFCPSEIAPEKMWEQLQRPFCWIYCQKFTALGCFAAGWAILRIKHVRQNVGWRRQTAIVFVVVSALVSLGSFSWAANRFLLELNAAHRISDSLDSDAYPGIIRVLDFRYHCLGFVDRPSYEAWIEFHAGNTEAFTDELQPAAIGDHAVALRKAHEVFPAFHSNPAGTVLSIRLDATYEGWVIPGESPIQCVVLAWRPRKKGPP